MDSFMKAVSSFKDKIVKTPLERLVHDACTDENWGVPNTSLHQISEKTFNHEERSIIMRNIWELLSSPAKEWRRLYKVLNLLDHLLKFGSTACSNEIQDNLFKIRMFQDFSFREGVEEKGIGVRDKAKYLLSMLSDASVLNEEREKAQKMWNKFNGGSGNSHFREESYRSGSGYDTSSYNKPATSVQNTYQEKPLFNPQSTPKPIQSSTPSSQAPKYNLWEVPSMKSDAFASSNPLKSLSPPSGFHPSGSTSSKPALVHSQSVTTSAIDLLLDDSPSFSPSNPPNPSSALPQLGKASSMFEDLLLSSGPAQSPNPPLVQFPQSSISQGSNFPFTQPTALPQSVSSLNQPAQVKPSGTFPTFQPDLALPTDLFSSGQAAPTNLFQSGGFTNGACTTSTASTVNPLSNLGTSSNNLIETSTPSSFYSDNFYFPGAISGNQSTAKKMNINLADGTSMEKMKSYGYSGFGGFASSSAKKEPETLEGKLFNLDDLQAGQPKVKEVPKSKW